MKKTVYFFATALLAISCNKNEEAHVPDSVRPEPTPTQAEVRKEVRKFSLFVDRHMKSAAMVKSTNAQTNFSEAVDAYMDEHLTAEETASVRDFVESTKPQLEEHAALCEALPSLEEAKTPQHAEAIIKGNFAVSSNPFGTLAPDASAVNGALQTLQANINAEIGDDLVNAYLLDNGEMSDAQVENLYETTVAAIKGKIANTIEGFRIGLIVNPNGLTREEVDMVGISALVALETINDDVLLDNVEEAVSFPIMEDHQKGEVVGTKFFFGLIGGFFGKLVRTVAIVALVGAGLGIGGTLLAFSIHPLFGIAYVAAFIETNIRYWKSTWGWINTGRHLPEHGPIAPWFW